MPYLKAGDTIAVLALSTSMHGCNEQVRRYAEKRLTEELGLRVAYGANARATGPRNVAKAGLRVVDLHNAFLNPEIKAIMMFRGGYHLNDILPLVDWDLIRKHWKPFIGYSDATAFQLAMYAKTGAKSFSGPMFTNFGELKLFDYTMEYFKKCLFADHQYRINPSKIWNDDNWPANQEQRMSILNRGHVVIHEGTEGFGQGILLGDNLSTMILNAASQEFMPSLDGSVLFMEDDNECGGTTLNMFVRRLEALTHRSDFTGVQGIVIGRFMKLRDEDSCSAVSDQQIMDFVRERLFLKDIPIISNANVGHTAPYATYPIGGEVRMVINSDSCYIDILDH